jgi:hypothetical protein
VCCSWHCYAFKCREGPVNAGCNEMRRNLWSQGRAVSCTCVQTDTVDAESGALSGL